MKDHEGDVKQYVHVSEAWYAKSALISDGIVDEVQFGFYAPEGGTSGEMGMRWHDLGTRWQGNQQITNAVPRLEVFNDAWHALWQFRDVLEALADLDDVDISPREFCQILERCGFTDRTARTREDG